MLPVSKPFLPPLDEVVARLRVAWDRSILTNQGVLACELESALRARLDAPQLSLLANGTLALQLALRALDVRGEVITTPFSFAATVTSALWEHCTPVFVDVDPATLNLDPQLAAQRISRNTQAILATHVYGNPCDVDAFEAISRDTRVPIVYDAAHAFGVEVRGRSVCGFGSASTLSFHATKVFHCAEGGALTVREDHTRQRVERLRNFGQSATGDFVEPGINAKLSEMHAALGLTVLQHLETIVRRRREVAEAYDAALGPDASLSRPRWHPHATRNYAYYPILLRAESEVTALVARLHEVKVVARRYFYPALSTLPYLESAPCPIAEDAARRVVCLPLHTDVTLRDIQRIAGIVQEVAS